MKAKWETVGIMPVSRRDCLKLGLIAGSPVALAGCHFAGSRFAQEDESPNATPPALPPEELLLNRIGFGPTPRELDALRGQGQHKYLEGQLAAAEPESLGLKLQLQTLDFLQMSTSELWDVPLDRAISQLQQAAILQAAYGHNQLLERMVDFWTNHFNIYSRKGNTAYSKGIEETKVVRANALGSFPQMLNEMAHSPAMLEYLDNQQNHRGVPNENYARELMELHTLGLHGGYTQRDVQEVARCFTGWTIETRFLRPKGQFRFDPDTHDDGSKTILGHIIAPGGQESDGEEVLRLLAKHPSTARFLAGKLCVYFGISGNVRDQMAAAFLRNEGDIKAMLRPLLFSSDLMESPPVIKRPFDFLVSALRKTRAATNGGRELQDHLNRMGEPLYQWPMPDGYPMKEESWTSSLLPRWNFAYALANDSIPGTRIGSASDVSRADLALSLAAPVYQWR